MKKIINILVNSVKLLILIFRSKLYDLDYYLYYNQAHIGKIYYLYYGKCILKHLRQKDGFYDGGYYHLFWRFYWRFKYYPTLREVAKDHIIK